MKLDGPEVLLWAAHLHHLGCLKLMIQALIDGDVVFNYSSITAAATYSANDFSMMLRHGRKFNEKLKQTFDYLLMKKKSVVYDRYRWRWEYFAVLCGFKCERCRRGISARINDISIK